MNMSEAQAWVVIISATGAAIVTVISTWRLHIISQEGEKSRQHIAEKIDDNTVLTEKALITAQNGNYNLREMTMQTDALKGLVEKIEDGTTRTEEALNGSAAAHTALVLEQTETIRALKQTILELRDHIFKLRAEAERRQR